MIYKKYLKQSITALAPAKLNLFLHITGQREDSYHNLETIFQLIDVYDEIQFTPNLDDQITLEFSELPLSQYTIIGTKSAQTELLNHALEQQDIQQNLIYRAAKLLLPHRESSDLGCHIYLKKNIPMGAGLGGGSSDAATTLLILNQLWQCHLNTNQLLAYAKQLGADVPIFIYGKNAWAEGTGDIITPLEDLTINKYIILKPDCFISTQTLFSQKDLTKNTKSFKFAAYQDNPNLFGNNFEPLVKKLYPEVQQAFDYLNQYGQAKLTGTGSCVFMIVTDRINTDLERIVQNAPCQAYIAHGLYESPLLQQVKNLF